MLRWGAGEVCEPGNASAPPGRPSGVPCRPPDEYYGRESISIFYHTNEFVGTSFPALGRVGASRPLKVGRWVCEEGCSGTPLKNPTAGCLSAFGSGLAGPLSALSAPG